LFAYKFVQWDVPPKPENEMTILLEKAQDGKELTRAEKDRIANILWGLFGCHDSTYKLAGWAWPMYNCLPRILVRYTYDNRFEVYYAPDKSSLRKCLHGVAEMVYAPRK
jgi:hypothetical protein